MASPRFFSCVPIIALAANPLAVAAQFHLPLPLALRGDTVCAIKSHEQSDSNIHCSGRWEDFEEIRDNITLDEDLKYTRSYISNRLPWAESDRELREYYRGDGLQYFRDFTATVRDDRIYLSTSLLAGLLGRTYFDFSIAKVVASADDDELDPQVFEDAVAGVYRLVNNGGSAAMHLLLPMYAGGGTLNQRAFGFFVQAGGMGPLDDPESMAVAGGVGSELLLSMAVRDSNYERKGELFIGLRAAFQVVSDADAVVPGSSDRTVPFGQVAVGLRAASGARLSLTFTAIEPELRDFIPAVQFALQTTPN